MSDVKRIMLPPYYADPLPPRAHDFACIPCPSAMGTDPEVEEILKLPLAERMETVFRCAWRPEKLCRGYWDKMTEVPRG